MQLLVYVHGVQHGFVEAGQVLVGNYQNLGVVLLELLGQVTRRKAVQRLFGVLNAIHHLFAGERHQRLEGRIGLFQSSAYGKEVADGAFDISRHHHGLGFALQLFGLPDAGCEVIDHDLGLHINGLGAGFNKGFQLLLGLGGIEQRVVLHRLLHLVVALVRGVLLKHVEDELFLDGLLHGIQVEGVELAVSSLAAKLLQRGRLGRGGERKVAGVLAHLALIHRRQNLVLHVYRLVTVLTRQGFIHLVSGHARLG